MSMANYLPIFYHRVLSSDCARIKRTIRSLGVEVEMRNVLLSRKNRKELRQKAGQIQVPCLVVSDTVVKEAEEIEKYLYLRYGERTQAMGTLPSAMR
jgi:glutaredoxin